MNDQQTSVKLYLGEALGLIRKTMPFIWIRLGSYALLGAGLLVYFAVTGGIAWLFGQLWGPLGFIVLLAAFGGAFGVVRWVTRYFFYLLKAAHAAVMTEIIVYGRVPDGSQVEYGKQQVMDRFADTSIMFAVDQILDGVVKAFNRTFARVARILPIPGLDSLTAFIERVSKFATTYVDEAILTRAYRQREANVWAVAQDGVILYAQCWKPILANAVVLTLLSYAEFFLFLILLGLPAVALGTVASAGVKVGLGIFVIVGAWMLKLALSDAYALAATLLAYHRATEGLTPDPAWQAKLAQASDKFVELKEKARAAAPSPKPTTDTPVAPATPKPAPPDASRNLPPTAGDVRPVL